MNTNDNNGSIWPNVSKEPVSPLDATVEANEFDEVIDVQDKPQEWNGEGYPPVNTECEIKMDGDYFKARIEYVDWLHCIFTALKPNATTTYRKVKHVSFRPLKSAEQLAAKKERANFVAEYLEEFGKTRGEMQNGAHDIYDWLKSTGRLTDTKGDV